MKSIILKALLPAVTCFSASVAFGFEYVDVENRVQVSGALCRTKNGPSEWDVYHYPGSTSVGWWASTVRLFCPLNRRNLHAYDKTLNGSGYDLRISNIWMRVDSPSGNLQCRIFARDKDNGTFLYTPWTTPWDPGLGTYVHMYMDATWRTLNWGVMCDVPGGEAILNMEARIDNQNF